MLVENRHFFIPRAFDAPLGRPRRNIARVWYGKTKMVELPRGEKVYQ